MPYVTCAGEKKANMQKNTTGGLVQPLRATRQDFDLQQEADFEVDLGNGEEQQQAQAPVPPFMQLLAQQMAEQNQLNGWFKSSPGTRPTPLVNLLLLNQRNVATPQILTQTSNTMEWSATPPGGLNLKGSLATAL